MKVCMCRDFDCATARKVIENESPEHAEDVHRKATGQDPQCGACLQTVDAMKERFNKEGKAPQVLEISREEMKEAARRLGERFSKEESGNDNTPPPWKKRYIR